MAAGCISARRSRVPQIGGSLVLSVLLLGCITVGGGNEDAAVSGSTGAAGSEGSAELQRCDEPTATAAVSAEHVNALALTSYGLPTNPLPALRLVLQQSNCIQVVHRDLALAAMKEERALAASGELQAGSNFAGGQMVAASGSGSSTDIGGFGGAFGAVSAGAGGYSNTNEGKVVMAAMVDAMNVLIPHLRSARPAG